VTAATTTELLFEWDAERPRSKQQEIGMSDVGGCEKRAGYRMAGTAPTNPSGSMQAILGSAIHEAVSDVVSKRHEGDIIAEDEVRFLGILGHFDRYHVAEKLIVDVKTTSSRFLETIKLNGADYQHRWQVALYAGGLFKTHGLPVERVRIDYIARDTGEEYNWPNLEGAPFDPRDLRDALQWIANVKATPLSLLPRKYLPDSNFCASCPFADPLLGRRTGRAQPPRRCCTSKTPTPKTAPSNCSKSASRSKPSRPRKRSSKAASTRCAPTTAAGSRSATEHSTSPDTSPAAGWSSSLREQRPSRPSATTRSPYCEHLSKAPAPVVSVVVSPRHAVW
jgi:CRISPR/Cas system-associated exonuclease Cas4 (RecB family)